MAVLQTCARAHRSSAPVSFFPSLLSNDNLRHSHFCLALSKLVTKSAKLLGSRGSLLLLLLPAAAAAALDVEADGTGPAGAAAEVAACEAASALAAVGACDCDLTSSCCDDDDVAEGNAAADSAGEGPVAAACDDGPLVDVELGAADPDAGIVACAGIGDGAADDDDATLLVESTALDAAADRVDDASVGAAEFGPAAAEERSSDGVVRGD